MDANEKIKNLDLDLSALNELSEEARELAFSILDEYSKEGKSDLLNKLILEDYAEVPADILTFVDDYNYLGNAWHDSEGKSKLYPYWRKELIKIFPDNITTNVNNAIFSGSRGRGKAQPLYSLVYTENGYRKMGDLKIGEKVYGDDGKLHPILGIFPQGKKPIYELTFTDGSKTRSSDEHLWTVRDNNDMKWKTITVKQMLSEPLYRKKSNQSIFEARYKLPLTKTLVFNKQDTFISPYMMGCLIGDGCFSNSISLTTCDEEILNAFLYELDNNGYTAHKDKNSYLIKQKKKTMHNKYKDELVSLGLFKHRSWEKFIPDIYLHNDIEARLELLRGLLDTDGTITPESIISYTTTSETLAEQIVFLVQSLGGTAKIYYSENATYKNKRGDTLPCRDSFTVSIKLPSEIIPFKLNRKIARLNPRRIEPQRNLIAIEYIGEEECQCIYIDSESHLYLTDNLIVTHNTEIAVLIAAYLLHRLLCLKDPISFFHLKPTEKIVFAFMNIKKDLAEEIGIAKFQNTIQSSPWFLSHGTIEGRTRKIWVPQKFNNQEAIDIKIGSQADDLIGLPIYFCLDGDTKVLTTTGTFKISELVNKPIQTISIDENNQPVISEVCTVKPTATSDIEYEIELEDGSIIKCTPNHRFMLLDGTYKEAQHLTELDEILDFVPYGYIYKTTNLVNGKIYIGQHKNTQFNNNYLGSGHLIKAAVKKYGRQNFTCELIQLCKDKLDLDTAEKYFIKQFNSNNLIVGYNIVDGGQGGDLGPISRARISKRLKGRSKTEEHKQRLSSANLGKTLSEATKQKISLGNSGKMVSLETKQKMSIAAKSKDHTDYKGNKNCRTITDGYSIRFIDKDTEVPCGWRLGNCKTAGNHNMERYYANSEMKKNKSEAHKGERNGMYGKGHLRSGGNNTKARTRYFYASLVFECRDDLVKYLKENVDNRVSQSLIRAIENNKYKARTAKKFLCIIENLKWEAK